MDRINIWGDEKKTVELFLKNWISESTILAHTSGSTGKPKSVRLLKSDMITSAEKTCKYFNLNEESLLGLPLSTEYIAGKMMIVRALVTKADLWCESPSMQPLCSYNLGRSIDLLAVVPSQIPGLLISENISFVKNLLIGGAPLAYISEKELIDRNIQAFCSYGMTETCSHVALRKVGTPYYKGLPGVHFDQDSRGCLTIECNDFSFNRIITNDIVRLIDNESFEWIGRFDNVINTGGIKIHPEEIESKISDFLSEYDYYITSRKSQLWGDKIVLIIESEQPIAGLQEILCGVLSKYERPKEIHYVKELSRTETGKIIRRQL